MKRAATVLFLLGCVAVVRAQPVQTTEIAAKLLRCSILYLAISDIRSEQLQQGRGPSPFLFQGMAYRGMALALTNSDFVFSELEVIGETIGSRSAADVVALLNDAGPECAELPLVHAQLIGAAFERVEARTQALGDAK